MSDNEPTAPRVDGNGRDRRGRFGPGNREGRGNPLAGQVAKLRAAMVRGVKAGDMRKIIAAMVAKATNGDTAAANLVFRYSVGEPLPQDILARLESLENRGNQP